MPELNFDTGLVTYTINGKVEITFNPTDMAFIERLYSVFDEMNKRQELYETERKEKGDTDTAFDPLHRQDREVREMIDTALGQPVCDALFGGMNIYTSLANGLPAWCNLIFTILAETCDSVSREQKAINPRLQEYLAKYSNKTRKHNKKPRRNSKK